MANDKAGDRRPRHVNDANAAEQLDVETERRQCADIGADAEEGDVAEAELAGDSPSSRLRLIAPMMKMPVVISAFRRYGSRSHSGTDANSASSANPGKKPLHPTRSERANRPVGLNSSTAMMIRKPIASR